MKHGRWRSHGMARAARAFWRDESGQNLVEYGLLVGLIGIGAIAASSNLRNSIATVFNTVGSQLAAIS